MFERFTDRALRVVIIAQEEARMLNHNYIGDEHLLLGLIKEGEGVAAKAIESLTDIDVAYEKLQASIIAGSTPPTGHVPFTDEAKTVLERSLREALQLGHNYIGTEHILLALCRLDGDRDPPLLPNIGLKATGIRQAVIMLLAGYTNQQVEESIRSAINRILTRYVAPINLGDAVSEVENYIQIREEAN